MAVNELLKSKESGKGVCAKTLSYGNVAWKCETCEKDPTCIICQDCFEKGDHKGHKVWLKRNVSGCCDCGDPDAWAEQGFCSKHKGYVASIDTMLEQLPPFIKKSVAYVFRHVALQLKIQSLKLQIAIAQKMNYKGVFSKESIVEKDKRASIITLLFEFMDWSVEVSPAFIHFWTDQLNESFIQEIKKEASLKNMLKSQYDAEPQSESYEQHQCCPKSYINHDDRKKFSGEVQQMILDEDGKDSILLNQQTSDEVCIFSEDTLRELRILKGVCTCRVLDLTFQINHQLTIKCRNIQYELYFKMFQSFKFKQILGLAFGANYGTVSLQKKNVKEKEDRSIGSIGVQVLTIDEISLMIVKDDNIRNVMLETLTKAIDTLIEEDFDQKSQESLFTILYDFKYMTRHQTLNHLITKTNFIEQLLQQVSKLYYKDIQEYKTDHVMFDQEAFKEGLYNIDLFIFKVLKAFLKAVDFTDVERNKRIMSVFIGLFTELKAQMPERSLGFFAIPLHRIFSYYLNRLLMQNQIVKFKKIDNKAFSISTDQSAKLSKDIFLNILKQHIDVPQGQNVWKYLQSIIEIILTPLARKWTFCHEVLSGKWVMSGLYLTHLGKLIYSIYENYLLMHLGLFQLLVAASPEPGQTIDLISQTFNSESWMSVLASKLHSGGLSCTSQQLDKDYEQLKPLFDQKKLRSMINWQLKLYIQLAVTETPILYPLLTNLSKKESLTFPVQNDCNQQIELFYKNDMRRAIVHGLILLGGRGDFKQIKDKLKSQDLYLDSEFFEDELLKVATQSRDNTKGSKVQFKLNEEEYLNWFDPYYYLIPESQSNVQEVLQTVYQEKKLLNEVLGDYTSCYKYSTPIPQLVAQGLASSPQLLTLVSSLLTLWANQVESKKSFKVVDDQIGYSLLKLVQILLNCQQKEHHQESVSPLMKMLLENNMIVIMSLKIKAQQHAGTAIERACKELLKQIYHLDPQTFAIIAEMMGFELRESSAQGSETNVLEEVKSMGEVNAEKEAEKKKETAKKRQEAILKKFQRQRETFTEKVQVQSQSIINSDTSMVSSRSLLSRSNSVIEDEEEENLNEIECSLCKENLNVEDHSYLQNPFGQFAYISTSKLLYHTYRQALEPYFGEKRAEDNPDEEEKKQSELERDPPPLDPLNELNQINCLDFKQGTGGVLIKCSHYAHHKCLSSFLTTNEADSRKRELKRIIGLDFQTFQCPLCKHIANVLLPFNPLTHYQSQSANANDFNQHELLLFQCDILSKIVKAQDQRKKDLLPVDIRSNPKDFLGSIQRFVEHKIQLLDVKGLDEFLRKKHRQGEQRVHVHNRVGKEQYADIIQTTRNVLLLIVEGIISVGKTEDTIMNDQTIETICLGEISNVFEKVKGWQLMEQDLSSILIQMMFYTIILYGCDNFQLLDKVNLELIKSVYQMFNLQTYLKAQFAVNSFGNETLSGKPHEILSQISNRNKLLNAISKDPQFQEQYIIPSQLSFLRKLAAFKVLTHTIHWRNQRFSQEADFSMLMTQENYMDLKKRDDEFVQQLSTMVDDKVEFKLLSQYLGIEEVTSVGLSEEKDLMHGSFIDKEQKIENPLPDEILEVVNYFKSEENQQRALESYALSKVIQLLNPSLVIDEKETPIIKEQILQSEKLIRMEMPAHFRLLQPNLKFRLTQLPNDFQSMVQTYYKRKCRNCNTQPKEMCVCLLCGEIVCFLQKCCMGSIPMMKAHEGELSFHTRMCEGNSAIFICTTKAQIILVEEERSCQKPSPYINKFGETFSSSSKKWENYHLQIQQQPGVKGLNQYDELRKLYMNFSLANEIIKERSSSETVWRIRAV